MIEKIVRDWLMEKLDVPVYTELPPSPPARYVLIETVGGDMTNHIHSAMVSAVTRGSALMDAIETAGRVKKEMLYGILESDDVQAVNLNGDANGTDEDTKRYGWQSVFEITYQEDW